MLQYPWQEYCDTEQHSLYISVLAAWYNMAIGYNKRWRAECTPESKTQAEEEAIHFGANLVQDAEMEIYVFVQWGQAGC